MTDASNDESLPQIEVSIAEAAHAAAGILNESIAVIPQPVRDLIIAMARHTVSLKWAVKLLEGRLALRDSLAETQLVALHAPLEELLKSLEALKTTDWGIRRSDKAVFIGAVDVEADRVRRSMDALGEWYTIMTDPTFVFEREVLERLPLSEVLDRVVDEIDNDKDKSRVVRYVPEGLLVSTSAERLAVILAALADNALKHGGDGPVEIASGLNEDQELWIEISDRGPGLEGKDPETLWRSLSDRDGADPTGQMDGLSLGLYLARIMVESLNGVIELDDREGGGLSARIFLPQRRRGDF